MSARSFYFPDRGLNLHPPRWQHGVLTTGPLGTSPLGKDLYQEGCTVHPLVPRSAQGLGVSSHRTLALLASAGFDLCRDKRINCSVYSSACFISTRCLPVPPLYAKV